MCVVVAAKPHASASSVHHDTYTIVIIPLAFSLVNKDIVTKIFRLFCATYTKAAKSKKTKGKNRHFYKQKEALARPLP